MSDGKLALLAGSLVAIFLITWLVRRLGLGRTVVLADAAAAKAEAEVSFAGFEARSAIISSDGAAALVEGADGSIAVLKRHGAHVAARRLPKSAIVETATGWRAETGEARFGAVLVRR